MKTDLHTHTRLSCDANATIDGYLDTAFNNSLDIFGISEHVDYNKLDTGYGFYRPEAHLEMVRSARNRFTRGRVLFGLEFSEPHLYPDELLALRNEYPYDYMIGSVHWVCDMFPQPNGKMLTNDNREIGIKEFYRIYWNEVLQTVKMGNFEILGHIDFPKRYFHELWYDESTVLEIFKHIIDKEIALEINTSSLRKGLSETMPGSELLSLYHSVGGKYVTIGSDSHEAGDLGADIECAKALILTHDLQEVYFEERKRILIS